MILQYFFPLAVLVFTYTRIALAVWGKKAPGEAEDGRDQRLAKAKRKVVNYPFSFYSVHFPGLTSIISNA
jgi:neuropeptide Y receptor